MIIFMLSVVNITAIKVFFFVEKIKKSNIDESIKKPNDI